MIASIDGSMMILEDWLSKNSNATGRNDAINMNLAESLAFIKNIE